MIEAQHAVTRGSGLKAARQGRAIELVIVRVRCGPEPQPQKFGLPAEQVETILRPRPGQIAAADDGPSGRLELRRGGGLLPLLDLGAALHPSATPAQAGQDAGEGARAGRVLLLRRPRVPSGCDLVPEGAEGAGLLVDEVLRIVRWPVAGVLPFPLWVIRDLPADTVWGAIEIDGEIILLLDSWALVQGER